VNIGDNIKKIRKDKGVLQKEAAAAVGLNNSNYNRMENGHREPTVASLIKLAELFGVNVDYLINPKTDFPVEVHIEDKFAQEQVRLINQLSEDNKQLVEQMINKLLTNQKFRTFFQQNID